MLFSKYLRESGAFKLCHFQPLIAKPDPRFDLSFYNNYMLTNRHVEVKRNSSIFRMSYTHFNFMCCFTQ